MSNFLALAERVERIRDALNDHEYVTVDSLINSVLDIRIETNDLVTGDFTDPMIVCNTRLMEGIDTFLKMFKKGRALMAPDSVKTSFGCIAALARECYAQEMLELLDNASYA